ncbi:hypothetical protein EVAR_13630_1 [Eumeta japonica]|uniref:Uncharacterized protein n=1 Tax=Eumeta variegata TaxID=151549 RepID=A0A4C1UUL3_EUMVA|nr:hypothetical protein EVAR_13630_1 [Eumeta japonica]
MWHSCVEYAKYGRASYCNVCSSYVQADAPSINFSGISASVKISSGCSAVAIGGLRSNPLDHPFSLVCYCVLVFLRAAFWSVGLRMCMSVCGAAQYTSRGDSYTMFAFVPVIRYGLLHRLHTEPTHDFCA